MEPRWNREEPMHKDSGLHNKYEYIVRIKFTSNSNYRSKSRVAIVIIATTVLLIAAATTITTGTPAAFAQQPESGTTDPQDMRATVQQTQQISTQHVTTEQQQVNGLQFIPRWGPIIDIDSDRLMVLFANCETGEFAVSGQHIFTSAELEALQSFAIGLPDNLMSWLIVVENEGTELAPASVGVICTDESGAVDDGVDLDISTKTSINNVVNQFIRVAGGQIINLGQIINIYQNITQVAYQYVNITGNNNTVNQIINQSASQIVAANGTNIGQIINQTAVQAGIITPEQAGNTTTPTVQRQIGPGAVDMGPAPIEDIDCNLVASEAGQAYNLGRAYKVPEQCIGLVPLPSLDSEGNVIPRTPLESSSAVGPSPNNVPEDNGGGAPDTTTTTPPATTSNEEETPATTSTEEEEEETPATPPAEEEEEETETTQAAPTTDNDGEADSNPETENNPAAE